MTSQAVFDPKLNIVGVDPDSNQIIQIPGSEFQAPTNDDTYAEILLYPNMFSRDNRDNGIYTIGFGLKVRYSHDQWLEPPTSFLMRAVDPHISVMTTHETDYAFTINRKYDKYIEWTDFIEYQNYASAQGEKAGQYERGWVRYDYGSMKSDGIYFPADYSDQAQGWNPQPAQVHLNFNIEIYNNGWENNMGGFVDVHDTAVALNKGPYNSPTVIPVRANIHELKSSGQR